LKGKKDKKKGVRGHAERLTRRKKLGGGGVKIDKGIEIRRGDSGLAECIRGAKRVTKGSHLRKNKTDYDLDEPKV